jgi:hypothetical protein
MQFKIIDTKLQMRQTKWPDFTYRLKKTDLISLNIPSPMRVIRNICVIW